MNKYRELRSIYRNGKDEVFSAMRGNQKYIVKQIKLNSPNKDSHHKKKKQVELLQSLKNEHIVSIQQAFQHSIGDQPYLAIVFKYCSGGTISDLIGKNVKIKIDNIYKLNLMLQMARGISFLHSKEIVHRDIKPDNILLHRGNIKIADFGEARYIYDLEQKDKKNIGTYMYLSPQMLEQHTNYGFPVDVWALGIVFLELMSGISVSQMLKTKMNPAADSNFPYKELFRNIRRTKFQEMIRNMLLRDPEVRIDIKRVIKHLKMLINEQNTFFEFYERDAEIPLIEDDKILLSEPNLKRQEWIFRKDLEKSDKQQYFKLSAICDDSSLTDLQLWYTDDAELLKIEIESFEVAYTFNELPLRIKEEFRNIRNVIQMLLQKTTEIYYLESGRLYCKYFCRRQKVVQKLQVEVDLSVGKMVHQENRQLQINYNSQQDKTNRINSQADFIEKRQEKPKKGKKNASKKQKNKEVNKIIKQPILNILLSEKDEKSIQIFTKYAIEEQINFTIQEEQLNAINQEIKMMISSKKGQSFSSYYKDYVKKSQTILEIKEQLLLMESLSGQQKLLIPLTLTKLGKKLFQRKLYSQALSPFNQALVKYEELNFYKSNIYAETLCYLGKTLVKLENMGLGLDFFQESIDLYIKINSKDAIGMFKVLVEIGKIYIMKRQYDKAFQNYSSALQKINSDQQINEYKYRCRAQPLTNMGIIKVLRRQYLLANQYFEQAYYIFQDCPSIDKKYLLKCITMLHFSMGKFQQAMIKYEELLIFIINYKLQSQIKKHMQPLLEIFKTQAFEIDIQVFKKIRQITNTCIPQQKSIIQEISRIQSKIFSNK